MESKALFMARSGLARIANLLLPWKKIFKTGFEYLKKRKRLRMLIGITLGAIAGFAWYRLVGCASGACPLTSNPYISTFYGALMGFLISH